MKYLLYKSGTGYWKPRSCGYTENILEAGFYDENQAREFMGNKSSHSYALPLDDSLLAKIRGAVYRLNTELLEAVDLRLTDTWPDVRD